MKKLRHLKLSPSEKASRAAKARHAAERRRREVEGAIAPAGGGAKAHSQRRSVSLDEVPPFCFLLPGLSPEVAAISAVKALGMSHPVDALHTLWKLRAIAQAEQMSAKRTAKTDDTPMVQAGSRSASHNSTHKSLVKGEPRTD